MFLTRLLVFNYFILQCFIVTVTVDKNVTTISVSQVYIEDLKEEFVKEFIFPAVQANAIYEDRYLMGTGN